MKRWTWLPWFIGICFAFINQRVNAADFLPTTKEELNFEINSIEVSESTMTITGWALITDAQHYRSSADHKVWIEILSLTHQQVIEAQITPISMTSISLQAGQSLCADNIYFSTTCNYDYDNVGFSAVIDLSVLVKGEQYTTNILFSALNANVQRKTPLYYPIMEPVTRMVGDYRFSAISSLDDTTLRISATPVYARKEPTKTSAIWAYGTNCSTSYANRLYFKYGAIFNNILNRFPIDNQTYYAMSAKLDICVDGRRRIVEGTQFNPVWISSLFIEYSGSPLTIRSELINTAPVITAEDQTVMVGEPVNLLSFASAFDAEEGDISHKIQVSSDYADQAGNYVVTYLVVDKYGYTGSKTIQLTVVEPDNSPPYITAFDRTILQFTPFDPYHDVFAHDLEEGDITQRMYASGEVNTDKLGIYVVCYSVEDSKRLSDEKCIQVTVISFLDTLSRYRMISIQNPFYNESYPTNWIQHLDVIRNLKEMSIPLISVQLLKKPR
jgi:hypothetical protein